MGLVLSCTHMHVENNGPQSWFKLTNSENATSGRGRAQCKAMSHASQANNLQKITIANECLTLNIIST